MTRVKVCGITTETDRDAGVQAGADALGFLVDVAVDTDRELSPARAATLIADVPPFVNTVLVTMPTDANRALELLDTTGADTIQLHNDLPTEAVASVAEASDARVIKAIDAEPGAAERYADLVDAVLIDSRTASGAGGTGRRNDWEAAASIRRAVDRPVILAGGLTPANVAEAVETVRPFAVDVSSGVEAEEGRKDHEAIRSFVNAAKRRPVRP